MRSAVYYVPHDVRIDDVDEPEAGPGRVKLRVAHNGVSAPVALGHEFSGTVVGIHEQPVEIEPVALLLGEAPLVASLTYTGELRRGERMKVLVDL